MAKLRENVITNCEKTFVIKNLNEYTRLDGRAFDEFRKLTIDFGRDWGSCYVSLGKTKVFAQVSCEIMQPKSSRPSEGILNINIELNPLGAPNFESNRQTDLYILLNRILEKCIMDSNAVDLESLCIKVNEKVWAFRVDVNVLNHEGNLIECASIAALTALAHFRRPDVSCDGEKTIVHSYSERDAIHTVIHHYPVCISFAIFNEVDVILADPTVLEEGVADASLIIALNGYKELCGLHLGGRALVDAENILLCSSKAANRANTVVQEIKRVLVEDSEKRSGVGVQGFKTTLSDLTPNTSGAELLIMYLDNWQIKKNKTHLVKSITESTKGTVESLGKGSAVLLPVENSKEQVWKVSSDESESDGEVVLIKPKEEDPICIRGDSDENEESEEDEVTIINATQYNKKKHFLK
ncbi:hypothetical protein FQA39_LY08484 [Lamprigera yunnana]|nr:hypothetical protein FQA39_LY08484 [Lamprigera yunnana]